MIRATTASPSLPLSSPTPRASTSSTATSSPTSWNGSAPHPGRTDDTATNTEEFLALRTRTNGVLVEVLHFPSGDPRGYNVALEDDTNTEGEPVCSPAPRCHRTSPSPRSRAVSPQRTSL